VCSEYGVLQCGVVSCSVLQYLAQSQLRHITTHCNTLQHTATYCNTYKRSTQTELNARHCRTLQDTARHCKTLQDTARHCKTLQDIARHCKTLQDSLVCMHVMRVHMYGYVSAFRCWQFDVYAHSHAGSSTCKCSQM